MIQISFEHTVLVFHSPHLSDLHEITAHFVYLFSNYNPGKCTLFANTSTVKFDFGGLIFNDFLCFDITSLDVYLSHPTKAFSLGGKLPLLDKQLQLFPLGENVREVLLASGKATF